MLCYSVVIISHRFDRHIYSALSSIFVQATLPEQVIFVVNTANTEKFGDLRREFPKINWVFLGRNWGANYARNEGVKLISSEYIAFMDFDDEWLPNRIASIEQELKGQSPDLICHDFWSAGSIHEKRKKVISVSVEGLLRRNSLGGFSSTMIKTETFLRLSWLDNKLLSCQDWDYWLRAYFEDCRIKVINTVLSLHRINNEFAISRNNKSRYFGLRRFYLKHRKLLDDSVLHDLSVERLIYYRSLKRATVKVFRRKMTFHSFLRVVKHAIVQS